MSVVPLSIRFTGIRNDDIITNTPGQNQNKGTIIRVKGEYPTSKIAINSVNRQQLLDSVRNIPSIKNLTDENKVDVLFNKSIDNDDLYINDVNYFYIKFINIGGKGFTDKLSKDQIDYLLKGNPNDKDGFFNIIDIYSMIPKKPGSKTRRHTLIFRPDIWSIQLPILSPIYFNGLAINIDTYEINNQTINRDDGNITIFKSNIINQNIAIKYSNRSDTLNFDKLKSFIIKLTNTDDDTINGIIKMIEWFTPAIYKSLLQKLIRLKPKKVTDINGNTYPTDVTFLVTFSLLLLHQGSFVPDIQRFVKGIESALKRLAVSICEDSYIKNYYLITTLYAGGLISQVDDNWKPSDNLIYNWMLLGLEAINNNKYFIYDTKTRGDIKSIDYYSLSYIFINELKSFVTDINMVSNINGEYIED